MHEIHKNEINFKKGIKSENVTKTKKKEFLLKMYIHIHYLK